MPLELVDLGTIANDGTGDTLRAAAAKINAAITQLNEGGGGGANYLHQVTTQLTHADLLALPTTRKLILAAPAAGRIRVPMFGFVGVNTTEGAYTGIDADARLSIVHGDDDDEWLTVVANNADPAASQADQLLTSGELAIGRMLWTNFGAIHAGFTFAQVSLLSYVATKGLYLYAANDADFTGGNVANTGFATVIYTDLVHGTGAVE